MQYWKLHPPVHVMLHSMLGGGKATTEEPFRASSEEEVRQLLRMAQ